MAFDGVPMRAGKPVISQIHIPGPGNVPEFYKPIFMKIVFEAVLCKVYMHYNIL